MHINILYSSLLFGSVVVSAPNQANASNGTGRNRYPLKTEIVTTDID